MANGSEQPSKLSTFRQQYPQYDDMSDDALASALHKKFYSDMPADQFRQQVGLQPAAEPQKNGGGFFSKLGDLLSGNDQKAIGSPSRLKRETGQVALRSDATPDSNFPSPRQMIENESTGIGTREYDTVPDYSDRYNTPLTLDQQKNFQTWLGKLSAARGYDAREDMADYDMQGAFLDGAQPNARGHFTDKFKKPNHPTFSTGSKYSGTGHGTGGRWLQSDDGVWSYRASPTNLQYRTPRQLKEYFAKREPDSPLTLPDGTDSSAQAGPQMSAWHPTLLQRINSFFGSPDKARAANAAAAQEYAKETGNSTEQFYNELGGHRPVLNPEGENSAEYATKAASILGSEAKHLPADITNSVLRTIRGGDRSVKDSWIDKAISATNPDNSEYQDPNYDSFRGIGQSLAFSAVGLGSFLAGSAAGNLVAPVAGTAAGAAASGTTAYRSQFDSFMDELRDHANQVSQKVNGRPLSQGEWEDLYDKSKNYARLYGGAEALTEPAGEAMIGSTLLKSMGKKQGVGAVSKQIAQIFGVEMPTETVTQVLQNRSEYGTGLARNKVSIADAARQVVVPTIAVSGLLGGGSALTGAAIRRAGAEAGKSTSSSRASGATDVESDAPSVDSLIEKSMQSDSSLSDAEKQTLVDAGMAKRTDNGRVIPLPRMKRRAKEILAGDGSPDASTAQEQPSIQERGANAQSGAEPQPDTPAWQQTRQQFYQDPANTGRDHEELVDEALRAGEPVSPRVMVDYPHLIEDQSAEAEASAAANDTTPPDVEQSNKLSTEEITRRAREGIASSTESEEQSAAPVQEFSPAGDPAAAARVIPNQPRAVTTGRGAKVDVQGEFVDADSLVASHTARGNANPSFPQTLQPRDRSRISSEAQIGQMARNLDPELLDDTPKASDGAPIVGPDDVVESGNGRVNAIRQAYDTGNGDAYRQFVERKAAAAGIDLTGMQRPIYVRRRTTDMDDNQRAEFTRQANQSDLSQMSPAEQARSDADRLSIDDLAMFAPSESGNVLAATNDEFLRRFAQSIGDSEAASLRTADGRWNKRMADRVQGAVFAKAYGDDRLLNLAAEEADPDIKNVLAGLQQAAPAFARARDSSGSLGENNMAEVLADGADLVRESRRRRQDLGELLRQQDAFSQTLPEVADTARFIDANIRSAKRLGNYFRTVGELTEASNRNGTDRLFDDTISASDILDTARQKNEVDRGGQEQGQIRFSRPKRESDSGSDSPVGDGARQPRSDQRTQVERSQAAGAKTGQVDPSGVDPSIARFSRPKSDEPQNLYVAHNLSADKLKAADRLGGLAAPSIAVGNIDAGAFDNFGDITLLAEPSLLESPKIKTFDADIYSPRQPRAEFQVSFSALDRMQERYDKGVPKGMRWPGQDDIQRDGVEAIMRAPAIQFAYLQSLDKAPKPARRTVNPLVRKAAGKSQDQKETLAKQYYKREIAKVEETDRRRAADGRPSGFADSLREDWFDEDGNVRFQAVIKFERRANEYQRDGGIDLPATQQKVARKLRSKTAQNGLKKFAERIGEQVIEGERLYRGFTNAGRRRYSPYTMDNVLREMTRELQGGENWNYGAGSIRAKVAKQLKSRRAIQAERDRIVSAEEMNSISDESQTRLTNLLDELRPLYKFDGNSFMYMDDASLAIAEGPRGLREAFNLTPEAQAQINDFVEYLRSLPTAYFEAKAQRRVGVDEFHTAVVPRGTDAETVRRLKDDGLKIRYYKAGDKADRERAIRGADKKLLFSRSGDQAAFETLVDQALQMDARDPRTRGAIPIRRATPKSWRAIGMQPLPVATTPHVLAKSFYEHNSSPSEAQLKNLPNLLADPMMIFESETSPGSYIVVTDEAVNGKPFYAAIHPGRRIRRSPETNFMATALPMDDAKRRIQRWMDSGLLRYQNTEKTRSWNMKGDFQWPPLSGSKSGLNKKIITESDVGQYFRGELNPEVPAFAHNLERDLAPELEAIRRHIPVQLMTLRPERLFGPEAEGVEGVYLGNQILLFPSNIASTERARQVLRHEAVGHFSMEQMLGDQFAPTLGQVRKLQRASPAVQQIAQRVRERYPDLDADSDTFQEELIAVMAEEGTDLPIMRRIIAAVRRFLRRIGLIRGGVDDNELRDLIRRGGREVYGGGRALQIRPRPFMRSEPVPTYYSEMARVLADKLPNRGPAARMREAIDAFANKGQIKVEELEWSGIQSWLDDQAGTVEKSDLLKALAERGVRTEETVLGRADRDNAVESSATTGGVRYDEHTLPGGENYRELLLQFPRSETGAQRAARDEAAARQRQAADAYNAVRDSRDTETVRARAQDLSTANDTRREAEADVINARRAYHSVHFEEPNVVAHLRMNERHDSDGNRVLFLEEVQSDWHQDARKFGYQKPDTADDKVLALLDEAGYEAENNGTNWVVTAKDGRPVPNKIAGIEAESQFAGNLSQVAQMVLGRKDLRSSSNAVPDAPFKKTWPLLAMKRAIRYAAENGIDRVAWTTGAQQAERYELSRHISRIEYLEDDDPTQNYDGRLIAHSPSGEKVSNRFVARDDLPDHIGAEAARKLLSQDPEYAGTHTIRRSLDDQDLRIGGQGMQTFYDQMLPKMTGKYIKKWGGRVGSMRVSAGDEQVSVHGFKITPAMREAAFGGQPMFSRPPRRSDVRLVGRDENGNVRAAATVQDGRWLIVSRTVDMLGYGIKKAGNRQRVEELMGADGLSVSTEVPSQGGASQTDFRPNQLEAPEAGYFGQMAQTFVYKAQDKFEALKRLESAVEQNTGEHLKDEGSPYLAETLYHGRARQMMDSFDESTVEPMLDALQKTGFRLRPVSEYVPDLDQDLIDRFGHLSVVDAYLYARHAPEANAELANINPGEDAMSGMSDEQAARMAAALRDRGESVALEVIADRVDQMTAATRALLVDSGLEKQATVDAWTNAYDHYVPLKGAPGGPGENGDTTSRPGTGRGFDTRGSSTKRRLGRQSAAQNILANVVAGHYATITRSEKNLVGQSMLRFAQENPSDLWDIDQPMTKRMLDPVTGLVTQTSDPSMRSRDNVFIVRVKGVEHHVVFNEDNTDAMRIAASLKNLGSTEMGTALKLLHGLNGYLSLLSTSLNPEFVISNFARDLQTAAINLNDTDASALKRRIIADAASGKAGRAIRRHQKGQRDSEWSSYYQDFLDDGAATGWQEGYDSLDKFASSLTKRLDRNAPGTWAFAKRQGRNLLEFIGQANTAVENSVRLSAYVHARENGVSRPRAAAMAKDLTVNFNRKGEAAEALNALYLFYNASIQGSARLMRAASSPKARRWMYGAVALGIALDVANRWVAGTDDDGENRYDRIPEYIKRMNWIVMLPPNSEMPSWVPGWARGPEGDYLKFPLPYGYNVLNYAGQKVGRAIGAAGGSIENYNPAAEAGGLLMSVMDAFNPIGASPTLLQLVSPTITDPMVQWAENKNFAGLPIHPEADPYGPPPPNYTLYYSGARGWSRWMAKELNTASGGTEVEPGNVNISPELIDHFYDFATGGVGRFLAESADMPRKTYQMIKHGQDFNAYQIPFLGKVYGTPRTGASRDLFYDRSTKLRYLGQEYELARSREDRDRYQQLRQEFAGETRMLGMLDGVNKQLRDLKKRKDRVMNAKQLSDARKSEIADQIEDQQTKLYHLFNRRYRQVVLGQSGTESTEPKQTES